MSKALDIANNLSEFDGLSPAIDLSDVTATNVTSTNVTSTNVNPTNLNIGSTHHTFTVKGIDAAITDSQSGTSPDVSDANSGQMAIYNGATKLWGINEDGWVQNPNRPCFFVTPSASYTPPSTSSHLFQANYALYNVGNMYDTSTYRFTAPMDGLYLFGGMYRQDTLLNYVHWIVYLNGTQVSTSTHGLIGLNTTGYSSFTAGAMTYQLMLSAGDYIDFHIYSAGTTVIHNQSYLHCVFLG